MLIWRKHLFPLHLCLMEPGYLIVWRWGEHVMFQWMFGHIIRVRHHQVPLMEVSREHKWDGADPLHDCIRLRCNL